MEYSPHDKSIQEKSMTPEDIALMLSQTMRDFKERKVTVRYVLAMSRLGSSLANVTYLVDLKKKVELIEQVLKQKPK